MNFCGLKFESVRVEFHKTARGINRASSEQVAGRSIPPPDSALMHPKSLFLCNFVRSFVSYFSY
jgi:hypothetical protein